MAGGAERSRAEDHRSGGGRSTLGKAPTGCDATRRATTLLSPQPKPHHLLLPDCLSLVTTRCSTTPPWSSSLLTSVPCHPIPARFTLRSLSRQKSCRLVRATHPSIHPSIHLTARHLLLSAKGYVPCAPGLVPKPSEPFLDAYGRQLMPRSPTGPDDVVQLISIACRKAPNPRRGCCCVCWPGWGRRVG
jgi:hypothetical protein